MFACCSSQHRHDTLEVAPGIRLGRRCIARGDDEPNEIMHAEVSKHVVDRSFALVRGDHHRNACGMQLGQGIPTAGKGDAGTNPSPRVVDSTVGRGPFVELRSRHSLRHQMGKGLFQRDALTDHRLDTVLGWRRNVVSGECLAKSCRYRPPRVEQRSIEIDDDRAEAGHIRRRRNSSTPKCLPPTDVTTLEHSAENPNSIASRDNSSWDTNRMLDASRCKLVYGDGET